MSVSLCIFPFLIVNFLCFRLAKGNTREVLLSYVDASRRLCVLGGVFDDKAVVQRLTDFMWCEQKKSLGSTVWHEFWWPFHELENFTRTSAIPKPRHSHPVTHIPVSILIQLRSLKTAKPSTSNTLECSRKMQRVSPSRRKFLTQLATTFRILWSSLWLDTGRTFTSSLPAKITPPSRKCPIILWVSLGSLQRPKYAKDAIFTKTTGLCQARYLFSWRHARSLKDHIYLSELCCCLCEECL